MASVSIYLNFQGNTEEAFTFYKKVFRSEFSAPIMRLGNAPQQPGMPPLSETEKNYVMHVALPLFGGVQLMATDMLESMGQKLIEGNQVTISLNPDTREEADRLFQELSEGAENAVAPHEEFWGYWGSCKDRFGIRWMFNITNQQ